MTYDIRLNLNKQFAKYLTQLCNKDTHVIMSGYYKVTFRVKKIMDPKSGNLYANFWSTIIVTNVENRIRVKEGKVYITDSNGQYIWEYRNITKPPRRRINGVNNDIRRMSDKFCGSFGPLFNIDSWRMNTKTITWPKG